MQQINLSRHEILICDLMGSVRRKNAMQFNSDRQVSNQNPYDMDIDGFKGEFIAAKYLKVMPDFSINERKNPIDLYWNNKSIDVKATRNPNGSIYVTEYHKTKPCDIYMQVILNEDGGYIQGWIDKKTLFEKATLTQGNHPSYKLMQNDLFLIEEIN